MKIVAFVGPSLFPRVNGLLEIELRPPAARGDILHAALQRPDVILLIDGYFDRVPSVWHKEILWALSQGIHVLGASSMGALRAAEMHSYGMLGVGRIFELFASGAYTDDDEVALTHASEADDYRPLSEALVNMRATLIAARNQGVIAAPTFEWLVADAKRTFYAERSYQRLLQRAKNAGLPLGEISTLRDWLPDSRVDQKREDALTLLRYVADQRQKLARPGKRCPFFPTDAWNALEREVRSRPADNDTQHDRHVACAEELLIEGTHGNDFRAAALRALCRRSSDGTDGLDEQIVRSVVRQFREEHGLMTVEAYEAWIEAQALSDQELLSFFQREVTVRRVLTQCEADVPDALEDHLLSQGRLNRVRTRAANKRHALAMAGMNAVAAAELGLTEDELWRWYVTSYLGRPVDSVGIAEYAFGERVSVDALRRTILREYCYRQLAREQKD